MNQTYSHSQTPEFDANKSQTTAILYQQPTLSEQHASTKEIVLTIIKELAGVTVLLATVFSVSLMVRSCADDVDRQHAQALKHQLQFSASNEGAR